ncbi:hypothetical protein FIV02_24495 [Pseudomonas sp. THAF187a]|nr:hypothetical protein FIV02_24495 [Pseudomonas sp. THAF187a]QFT44914.1 hypothetical protein FIU98_24475 [Pseudomonas sp. THAF42]
MAVTGRPAASHSSACNNRRRWRHCSKLRPVSTTKRRLNERGAIPAHAAHSGRRRVSPGCADSARAMRSSRASCGIAKPRGTWGATPSSSRMTAHKRCCAASGAVAGQALRRATAACSSADTPRMQGLSGRSAHACGATYRLQPLNGPCERNACGRCAGIHAAWVAGITQRQLPASTLSSPRVAPSNWPRAC